MTELHFLSLKESKRQGIERVREREGNERGREKNGLRKRMCV